MTLDDLLAEMGIDGDERHYVMEDMMAIGGNVTSVTALPQLPTNVTIVTHSPNRRECDEGHTHSLDMDSMPSDRLRVSGQPHRQDTGGNT